MGDFLSLCRHCLLPILFNDVAFIPLMIFPLLHSVKLPAMIGVMRGVMAAVFLHSFSVE